MHPYSHIVWSSLWSGIALDAVKQARAFVRAEAKDALDGAFRHVDHLLDALEEFGSLSRVSEALIAFARNQVGGVTLGQEDQVGIKRSALGGDTDDSRAVADQAFGRGVG